MSLEQTITTYGYPALFIGSLLEGETIVIVAGFLAQNGYLQLPVVMIVTFAGAFFADQTLFRIGRSKGRAYLDRRPHLEPRIDKIRSFLVRYQVIAILGYRFIYGMRTITPMVIGTSGYDPIKFFLLNLLSTSLWAVLVSLGGYFFGHALDRMVKDAEHIQMLLVALLALIAIVFWIWRYIIAGRKNRG